jgi:histidine triad (HIT) family protein
MAESCIFCAIVGRQQPAAIVAEDETTLAVMSLHPINPGHVLVMPRRHEEQFQRMDSSAYIACMLAAQRVAAAIEAVYSPKRVGLLIAGFDVVHVHIHVLPMHDYHDITSRALLEGRVREAPISELRSDCERLREALRVPKLSDRGER